MTNRAAEAELTAEIAELERLLADWSDAGDAETELGRRLVRRAIDRRRTELSYLSETTVVEGG
ncbi:MAG TPA: hypothetical protein VKA50_09045 [Gammaproteobacteria bacterium]|nr:hypothetical protein [Gammaproteobacteria bacterium]